MLDPACLAGSRNSPRPACGPDDNSRRSLQIFETFTAVRLRTPDRLMKEPVSDVASTRSACGDDRQPGDRAQMAGDNLGVAGRTGDARADCRCPKVDFAQQPAGVGDPSLLLMHRSAPRAELLAHRHGHRILQLRASDLRNACEPFGLGSERITEPRQCGRQPFQRPHQGQLDCCRVHIVGRLPPVDVVVGVQFVILAQRVAEELQRPVGDHLVGVHVCRGARSALHDIHHELVVQVSAHDVRAGPVDGVSAFQVEHAELPISPCRSLFHRTECLDQRTMLSQRDAADGEVLHGTGGVDTPVHAGRDRPGSEQIVLDAHVSAHLPHRVSSRTRRAQSTRARWRRQGWRALLAHPRSGRRTPAGG